MAKDTVIAKRRTQWQEIGEIVYRRCMTMPGSMNRYFSCMTENVTCRIRYVHDNMNRSYIMSENPDKENFKII